MDHSNHITALLMFSLKSFLATTITKDLYTGPSQSYVLSITDLATTTVVTLVTNQVVVIATHVLLTTKIARNTISVTRKIYNFV